MKTATWTLIALFVVSGVPRARGAEADTAKNPQFGVATTSGPSGGKLVISQSGGPAALEYVTRLPRDTKLSVNSACFIHPLNTPKGVAVTDLAPADHPHHRGVFLAFVEMHGAQDADFWGWGQHAPKEDRVIEHRGLRDLRTTGVSAQATVANAWKAQNDVVLGERLRIAVGRQNGANVVDLEYQLTPTADTRLARWAFSGFCVRLRTDGELRYTSPDGEVRRPPLDHTKPELDWPAADWYDATLKLKDGSQLGVAVVDHPQNPPALWHNEGRIGMINPCIVAPGEVKLKKGEPLVLRYRLVVHDGPPPTAAIKTLAAAFRKAGDTRSPKPE